MFTLFNYALTTTYLKSADWESDPEWWIGKDVK
jgi:hypothetical protein